MIGKKGLMLIGILLMTAGCAAPGLSTPTQGVIAPSPTVEVMMQSSPTTEMMMNEGSATPDAMLENSTTTPEAMMTEAMPATGGMMESGTSTPQVMATGEGGMAGGMMPEGTPTGMMADNGWLSTMLTDASTGKTFTLNDFRGKTVLVEFINTQCAACLQQQKSIQTYLAGGTKDLVVVSLDIAQKGMIDNLKDHLAMNNFPWSFAEAPDELITQVSKQVGSQYVDPANAPLILIDSDGSVHPLALNLTTETEINNAVKNFLPKM